MNMYKNFCRLPILVFLFTKDKRKENHTENFRTIKKIFFLFFFTFFFIKFFITSNFNY